MSDTDQSKTLPPVKDMVANLATTVKDSFVSLGQNGVVFTTEKHANERLEICNRCEFLLKDQMRCTKCGCFMTTKVKLLMAKCPVSKW